MSSDNDNSLSYDELSKKIKKRIDENINLTNSNMIFDAFKIVYTSKLSTKNSQKYLKEKGCGDVKYMLSNDKKTQQIHVTTEKGLKKFLVDENNNLVVLDGDSEENREVTDKEMEYLMKLIALAFNWKDDLRTIQKERNWLDYCNMSGVNREYDYYVGQIGDIYMVERGKDELRKEDKKYLRRITKSFDFDGIHYFFSESGWLHGNRLPSKNVIYKNGIHPDMESIKRPGGGGSSQKSTGGNTAPTYHGGNSGTTSSYPGISGAEKPHVIKEIQGRKARSFKDGSFQFI